MEKFVCLIPCEEFEHKVAQLFTKEMFRVAEEHFKLIDFRKAIIDKDLALQAKGAFITTNHNFVDSNLDKFIGLKCVATYSVGLDHINVPLLTSHGIRIANTSGVVCESTADAAFLLMLGVIRNVCKNIEKGRNSWNTSVELGTNINNKSIGIVGLGGIGYQVARRAVGFNMKINYHQRHRRSVEDEEQLNGAIFHADLMTMLPLCDFVVICCVLSNETRGMIGYEQFEAMKASSVLINVARGPIVDTNALIEALQANKIRGAGLDVTEPEPLPFDNPLLTMDQVLILPHIGTATYETRSAMANCMIENMRCGLNGETMPNQIN